MTVRGVTRCFIEGIENTLSSPFAVQPEPTGAVTGRVPSTSNEVLPR